MRLSSRRDDDADVIRARLRALLAEGTRAGGWLPDDDLADRPDLEDEDDATAPIDLADIAPGESGRPAGLGRHRAPGHTPRWDPGRLGARSLWVAGLVAALLLVGWTWLDRPRVEPAPVTSAGNTATAAGSSVPAAPSVGEVADTSATVVVSVVGPVARPGLVTLPADARVADALAAAGGLLPEADPASVNLAAVVADGQQIVVGAPGASAGPGATGDGSAAGAAAGGKLNLNTAGVAELDALPGVGPVLAQRIVDHRKQGPFTSVDQLDDVPGIGPARAAELAELVTV